MKDYEIIIVDNASKDNSRYAYVKRNLQEIQIITE